MPLCRTARGGRGLHLWRLLGGRGRFGYIAFAWGAFAGLGAFTTRGLAPPRYLKRARASVDPNQRGSAFAFAAPVGLGGGRLCHSASDRVRRGPFIFSRSLRWLQEGDARREFAAMAVPFGHRDFAHEFAWLKGLILMKRKRAQIISVIAATLWDFRFMFSPKWGQRAVVFIELACRNIGLLFVVVGVRVLSPSQGVEFRAGYGRLGLVPTQMPIRSASAGVGNRTLSTASITLAWFWEGCKRPGKISQRGRWLPRRRERVAHRVMVIWSHVDFSGPDLEAATRTGRVSAMRRLVD